MAWTASDYQTYTQSYAIAAVSQTNRQLSVVGDVTALCGIGDRIAVDSGGNIGSYTVVAVTYAPNATVITVSYALPSATVAGNIVLGPNSRTRVARIDQHIAEVSAVISESVSDDGSSVNTDNLQAYVQNLHKERLRLASDSRGRITRGEVVFL